MVFYEFDLIFIIMASAKPIFGYWRARGGERGQAIRFVLAYKGVDYEEKRYNWPEGGSEWFGKDKHSIGLDFPNLPYFIDNDFKLTNSGAVMNYVCAKWAPELLGATPQERGEVSRLQFLLMEYFESWVYMGFRGKNQ